MLEDRFELVRRVGAGGMGVVFEARDRLLHENVAVKLLHLEEADAAARFALEARFLASLDHPAIVRYLAHGVAADGSSYLAMEWLDGEDLRERLRRGPLDLAEALVLATRMAEALGAAHAKGIVHRDLKPSNIFLPGGRLESAKLIDFGVARVVGGDRGLTRTGVLVGTPAFMSPEQVRGERHLDGRSDLFALGAVLFACLIGHPPWQGAKGMAVMTKVLLEDAPRLRSLRRDLPGGLDELVARLLTRDRALRPVTASEVVARLAHLASLPAGSDASSLDSSPAITETEGQLLCAVLALVEVDVPEAGSDATVTHDGLVGPPIPASTAQRMESLVRRYGGRLETFVGGGYAVLFEGRGAATDLCARSALFALAVRDLLPGARIALAAGRAVLSWRAALDEVLETASAMLDVSSSASTTADGVQLDEVAVGLLGARFHVHSSAEGHVLLGVEDSDDAGRRLLGRITPFVGRTQELRIIEAVRGGWESTSNAHVVLVTGPAGIGKSRLVGEVLRPVRATERAQIWIGRGDPIRPGAPFGILAPALRQAIGLATETDPPEARARVLSRVGRHFSGQKQIRVADFLGVLLGIPDAGDAGAQLRAARNNPILLADQMLRAWEDFLAAEAGAQPVVIVLEDLHWGDVPTVKFVDAALRVATDLPLLVVAMGRPETRSLFPGLFAERRVTIVDVGELEPQAAARLAEAVLGTHVPPARMAEIIERGAGNAFYLEELIRAAAAGGTDGVPETVLAMTIARLGELDPEDRRTLRAGSVFGESFSAVGVARLLGLAATTPLDELHARLDNLIVREWLSTTAVSDPGRREYRFRHGLMREAAYATLTDHDRAVGHGLAAEWLESVGEPDALVLAGHFEHGRALGRAASFFRRAAEQALQASDLDGALARVNQAIRCGVAGQELGELRLVEAIAQHWRADHVVEQRSAIDALRLLPALTTPWYRAMDEVAEASLPVGDTATLVELAAAVASIPLELVAEAEARDAFTSAAATLAMQLALAGRRDLSEPTAARMETCLRASAKSSPVVLARAEFARGTLAMMTGDLGLVIDHARAAVDAFEEAGDLRNAALMRTNLGWALTELGEWAEAEVILREAATVAQRMRLRFVLGGALSNLGFVLARAGRLHDAARAEHEAVRMRSELADQRVEGLSRIYLSLIHRLSGDLEQAEREARTALEVLAHLPPTRAHALAALAEVLLARGAIEEALALAMEATAALSSLGEIGEGATLVLLVHAEALVASGDEPAARAAADRARRHVLDHAARISDQRRRDTFLSRVPENARALILAARWAV